MFPFYCNQCFRRRKYESTLELSVSRCGHILCNNCVQEKCSVCGRPFKAVVINRNMPTQMAEYFSSPMKQYQHYKKVMKFHHEQERRLVEHLCRTNGKENKTAQSAIQGYTKLNEMLKNQVEKERERIRKLREYTAFYDRRLEQACYMTPPIISQPRSKYPSRSRSVESSPINSANTNTLKRYVQPIKANIIFPNSPTLSGNNSGSTTTEGTTAIKLVPNKQRTPPPLLPFSQHNLLNPHISFSSSV